MKRKNVVFLDFNLFFLKLALPRFWIFFTPSAFPISSIFSIMVRVYKINAFDRAFYFLVTDAMITENVTFPSLNSNVTKEQKFLSCILLLFLDYIKTKSIYVDIQKLLKKYLIVQVRIRKNCRKKIIELIRWKRWKDKLGGKNI